MLTSPTDAFVKRVIWQDDLPAPWRPHDDPLSPVRTGPAIRFGRPAVGGVSTEALWEHEQAGESADDIAEEFSLPAESVRWALAYETSARAA